MFRWKIITLIAVLICAVCLPATSFSAKADSSDCIQIIFNLNGKSFVYEDVKMESPDHLVEVQIHERKINAPYNEKITFISQMVDRGADFKTALLTCMPRLESVINEICKNFDKQPVDSKIIFDPNRFPIFRIMPDRTGFEVNRDFLYADIYYGLLSSPKVYVKVRGKVLTANIKTGDNLELTRLRARYTNDFSLSSQNRKDNIALALKKINGTTLFAGEEFSFNQTVGKRTESNGFKEAKIIVNGKYVPGYGGGVCQVSTAIYNAALYAGLKITSVNSHSLECSYELPSFDAMVNSGWSDLRFVNDGERPVFIRAYSHNGIATVEIFGSRLPYVIKRESVTTFIGEMPGYDEIIDKNYEHFEENTPSGERKFLSYSHAEKKSEGYLLYYDYEGNLIDKVKIRTDKYAQVRGVIAISP